MPSLLETLSVFKIELEFELEPATLLSDFNFELTSEFLSVASAKEVSLLLCDKGSEVEISVTLSVAVIVKCGISVLSGLVVV